MYLRRCYRSKDGKRHACWALVKSVRTAKGPRQQVVAYLGEIDEAGRLGVQKIAGGKGPDPQQRMFDASGPRWVEVDLSGVRVENTRGFGGPWLAMQVIKKLGLADLLDDLMPMGREDVPWPLMSLVLVICRLCDPSSELKIAESLFEQSALADLLGIDAAKINDDRLYRALDRLLPHKRMPLGYELFAGNKADVSTVRDVVTKMEARYGKADRIWVMDRGMVSRTNLEFLKEDARRYIVGTPKTMLKRYEKQLADKDWSLVHEGLEVKLCPDPDGGTETFILCRSADRRKKEKAFRQFRHGETDRGGPCCSSSAWTCPAA